MFSDTSQYLHIILYMYKSYTVFMSYNCLQTSLPQI